MPRTQEFVVTTFGIPDFELQVMARIIALSGARPISYRLRQPGDEPVTDIYLLDADFQKAVRDWREDRGNPINRKAVTVLLGKTQPNKGYYLRRPLIASRFLKLLDSVVEQEFRNPAPTLGTTPVTSPASTTGTGTGPAVSNARYRALVVDDSLAVRKQVGLVLGKEKISADFADSGVEALNMINERSYDVIFLDVVMPGLDGYMVCKQIKRNRDRKHIPIIMLTGKSSPFDKVKGKLAGCDTYLTKPVSRKHFVETLEKYLPQAVLPE